MPLREYPGATIDETLPRGPRQGKVKLPSSKSELMQLIEFITLTVRIDALERAFGTHRSSKDQVTVKQTRRPIGRLDFDHAGLTAGVPCPCLSVA